ncbi:MAG: hypothetical protein ACLTZI_14495 [[Eubacterium] siraeum]
MRQAAEVEIAEKSPCTICLFDTRSGTIDEFIAEEGFDCIKPQDDADGNIYYIRRKYVPTKQKSNLAMDILMFPVRIIKSYRRIFKRSFQWRSAENLCVPAVKIRQRANRRRT